MSETELALPYEFKNQELLRTALTHRSAGGRNAPTYERLEFLGDRVLALVVADMLYDTYPSEDEGALAKRLVALVRRETLADVARTLDLGRIVRISRGEADAGGRENPAILADACEAVIGAIYRDGGLDAARAFIRRYWGELLASTVKPPKDAKTVLQEWAQGRGLDLPEYSEIGRSGPDHAPVFTIEVAVGEYPPERGEGQTKRVAEQMAAERLLAKLKVSYV